MIGLLFVLRELRVPRGELCDKHIFNAEAVEKDAEAAE